MPKDNNIKIMTFANKLNSWVKLIINIAILTGIITAAMLAPLRSKVNNLADRIYEVEIDHVEHCAESDDRLGKMVTAATLDLHLKNIHTEMRGVKDGLNDLKIQNGQFQQELLELIKKTK